MAGAGVPVSMDDRSAIAAAPEIVCPLPECREVAKNGHEVFLGVFPRPELWELKGVGNAVLRSAAWLDSEIPEIKKEIRGPSPRNFVKEKYFPS